TKGIPADPQRAGTGYYLALTFGTLLSSQGADAHDIRPNSRPSFEAVSPLYTGLRSSSASGALPAVSRASRPGPFSLGAGGTVHALGAGLQGGSPGLSEHCPEPAVPGFPALRRRRAGGTGR
ncbi:hypothetical protein E9529_08065, partial [Blastococcus sp. KM273128]|nr:hypothetical protein [Blastococcus sp. KM273128]